MSKKALDPDRTGACRHCGEQTRMVELECDHCGRKCHLKYLRGRSRPVLTHCPVCDHYWPYDYDGDETREAHLADHGPEPFGLGGVGEEAAL